jgi:hypothetical protein
MLYFSIFCVCFCVNKLENRNAFVEYVVSHMGMMLFEIILCEKSSRGSFAKFKGQSTFGFRFRNRWKSRKRLWVKACALFKEFVMDLIMVG